MIHRTLIHAAYQFVADCDGATAVEYALIVGLTVVAIVAAANGLWEAISYLYKAIEGPLHDATAT